MPVRRGDSWAARDQAGDLIPIAARADRAWALAALSGGRPIGLFGEWDGDVLTPLGAWAGGRFLPVA